MSAPLPSAIPLTVIGGFLGAGKTTLLNRLLREGDRRIAVLVNDFGAINIDAELIRAQSASTVSLTNGCVCCGLSGELMFALAGLRDGDDPPEHIVVEASGVGDPEAILQYADIPGFHRDAAVVVVDAESVRSRADDAHTGPQVVAQLRSAGIVVLNKSDLVSPAALAATREWLRTMVPHAGILDAAFGDVPASVLLGERGVGRAAGATLPAREDEVPPPHPDYATWSWAGDAPLDGRGLSDALTALPDGVLRVKGVLHLREDPERRYLVQLAGRRGSIQRDRAWGDDPPGSRLVLIGVPESIRPQELELTMARLTRS